MNLDKNLHEFCYYFTRYFEERMRYWRFILEENPDLKRKLSSKPVSILAALISAIPTVGKGIGSGIVEGEKYVNTLIEDKNASIIAQIAYSSGDNNDSFRNLLISGAVEIFARFEYQFERVTCKKGGSTRAMQKLGQDASNRLFSFLLHEKGIKNLTPELIQKGVLNGDSCRHKTKVLKLGRQLHIIETNEKFTTSEFYSNCGLRIKHNDTYTYYKKKGFPPILGHRILFDFEDGNLGDNYEIDSPKYFHKYILIDMDKAEVETSIIQFISKKNPLDDIKEFAKFSYEEQIKLLEAASEERQKLQTEILEDNALKHVEVKESIQTSQTTIITRLENALAESTSVIISQTDRVMQQNEEINKNMSSINHKQTEMEARIPDQKTVIVINADRIKEEGKRFEQNVQREAKKVEKEIRNIRDKVKKIRF